MRTTGSGSMEQLTVGSGLPGDEGLAAKLIWVLCDGKVLILEQAVDVMTEHMGFYWRFYLTDQQLIIIYTQ